MTLLVRNEADIIESNLDYHLAQGVDFVIVTDHGSQDGTRELLEKYRRAGVLRLIHDDGDGHHQSRRVTFMAQLAGREHGADWIIHNDADEFWWPIAGSLCDVFAAIPDEYGQVEVSRRVNFVPGDESPAPFHQRLVRREAVSFNGEGNPLESKIAHRPHPGVVVAPGNHWISGTDLRPVPISDMLEIFHFPMRDYAQYQRKVVQIGLGYEALEYRSPGVGRDQLTLLEKYRRGELRAVYDASIRSEAEDAASAGTVVEDRRLQQFMADLATGQTPAQHAGAAAAQALVAAALKAASTAQAAQATHEADVQRAAALTRELETAQAERVAAAAALEQVRASRIMRWTAPLRRRWYRLSGR